MERIMTIIKKVSEQQQAQDQTEVTKPTNLTGEAAKIWDEIKDLPIEMFLLPNQFVNQHCAPFPADPSKLFLTIRSPAVLPALETAIGKNYVVEAADKYVMVSRAVNTPVAPPIRKF
jgi:hypothetical protein